jgi:hypothetical protein
MDKNKTNNNPQVQVNVNLDTTPILYTDNVFITANEDGVVLDIAQKLGSSNQVRIVSRVGMSRQHAKKLATELGKLVVMTEGKSETGSKNVGN